MTLQRPEPLGGRADPRFEAAWTEHRRHLLDVGYRLLGSVSQAEDMVQEAYSRLLVADLDSIGDIRAWLTTVVSRLCLDELRSARAKREAYIGPWFPEPLVEGAAAQADPLERITLDDSVRMALLIVLEKLSPAERVVFVLHDVFQFPFDDVARMVGRTEAACRQLASRARRHIASAENTGRYAVDATEQRRIAEQFIAACESGELGSLIEVLDVAVAGWADLGGRDERFREPQRGRENVARRLMDLFGPPSRIRLVPASVNGETGVVALAGQSVMAVLVLTVTGGAISLIRSVADPRKLRHLGPLGSAAQ